MALGNSLCLFKVDLTCKIQILIISSLKVKSVDNLKLKNSDYLWEECGKGMGLGIDTGA